MAMMAPDPGRLRPAAIDRLFAANVAAATFYRAQLPRNHGPCNYLRDRGLGAVVDREMPWRVGFAPKGWTALTDHLHRQGFTTDDLVTAGLAVRGRGCRVFDLFRDRIVFPIRDGAGHTVAFIGRVWSAQAAAHPDTPKYLNSPDTPIYTKGRELFGLHEQRDRIGLGWPPVLVEGPADMLAVWLSYSRAGRTGLVGLTPCGTALTEAQLQTVVALPGARRFGVAVAFDGDQAGRDAADRAYDLLSTNHPSITARGARFAPGADPADLLRSPDGRATLRTTLERKAQPLLHLVIDYRMARLLLRSPRLLHEIESRVALARTLAPLLAERPPAAASAAVGHVAARAQQLTAGDPNGPSAAAETIRCLTEAVAEHLETTPPLRLPQRSAPGPPGAARPAAAAFPARPAPRAAGHLSAAASSAAPAVTGWRRAR